VRASSRSSITVRTCSGSATFVHASSSSATTPARERARLPTASFALALLPLPAA
jgi:hypothetical protein